MRVRDLLKIIFLKTIRNKGLIFFYSIIILCTILITTTLTFYYNYNSFISNLVNKNIGFRTLNVTADEQLNDEITKKILNIKHVVDVYSSEHHSITLTSPDFKNENLSGIVELTYGAESMLPNNIIGRSFNNIEKNVAICPIDFFPDDSASELFINNEFLIDGHDLLGKEFSVEYYSHRFEDTNLIQEEKFEKKFKIVGLYDSKAVMNNKNQCYIQVSDLKEILETTIPSNMNEYVSSYLVVINDIENIEYVKEELANIGYKDAETKNFINLGIINIIMITCISISTIIIFALVILTISYIKKKIMNETHIIGVMRAIGYEKKDMKNIYILETAVIILFTYLIGITIFFILYFILKYTIFASLIYSGITIYINGYVFLISFLMVASITFVISLYFIIKSINSNVISLLKSGE
ncbi:MAG: ABC transporter permease [Bacilli bacterium]|nr:ABC transporter permease [Bacilli bacterium]MDD4283010.1 ABC transporter permease [Bacilli bacterium]